MASHRTPLAIIGVIGVLLAGFSLSIDFPRLSGAFWSDSATYYTMAHSLAEDGDLRFAREDVQRVFREFENGPSGIFLKRGRSLDLSLSLEPPFLINQGPLNDDLFFAKAFLYSATAAPFVFFFGTNGLLLMHAAFVVVVFVLGYFFLAPSMSRGWALAVTLTFFGASVAPAYYVWLTPELFNLSLVFIGLFFWLYKEVAPDPPSFLAGGASDIVAAAILGAVTYSKLPNALFVVPIVLLCLKRRQIRRALGVSAAYWVLVGGLFTAHLFVSGEMNFQGGDRKTFSGRYPYQRADLTFDNTGIGKVTSEIYTQQPWDIVLHDLYLYHVGRFSGMAVYCFPAFAAIILFLFGRRRSTPQWLVLGIATLGCLLWIVWMPVNYFGGGGTLGNRYFLNIFPAYFFLLSSLRRPMGYVLASWAVAGLFLSSIFIDPFEAGRRPGQHATSSFYKRLPAELSLINDLPTNNDPRKFRQRFDDGYLGYFLDDNTWGKERRVRGGLGFHVRGGTEAEVVVRTGIEPDKLVVRVTNVVSRMNEVRVCTPGGCERFEIEPGVKKILELPAGPAFPYEDFGVRSYCYLVKIWVREGEVPILERRGTRDKRYLGAFIHIEPDPYPGIE